MSRTSQNKDRGNRPPPRKIRIPTATETSAVDVPPARKVRPATNARDRKAKDRGVRSRNPSLKRARDDLVRARDADDLRPGLAGRATIPDGRGPGPVRGPSDLGRDRDRADPIRGRLVNL